MTNSTTFVDKQTVISAPWLNDVNTSVYTALGDGSFNPPTTPAGVRSNLGLTASSGASLVGFSSPATGAVATSVSDVLNDRISIMDFLTSVQKADVKSYTGSIDLATPFAAALAYCQSTGRELYCPAGAYGLSSLSQVITTGSQFSLSIRGEGSGKTIFRKFGTSTAAVLKFSATTSLLQQYHHLRDFTIQGNNLASNHSGIEFTDWAMTILDNVEIKSCYKAVSGAGFLTSEFHACNLHNNYIGASLTWDGVSIYTNAIKFIGGNISFNSHLGVDFDRGTGLHFYGTNIEGNGTAGDLTSGGVSIGGSIQSELGMSQISFDGCWFEGNLGQSIQTSASAGNFRNYSLKNTIIIPGELIGGIGYAFNSTTAAQISITDCVIVGLNAATVTAQATSLVIYNSTISVLNNASTNFILRGVETFSGRLNVISGTVTNDSAPVGCIGEYVSSSVSSGTPISLTTNTSKTVTSISLTAGDWDVSGLAGYVLGGTTNVTYESASFSLIDNTGSSDDDKVFSISYGSGSVQAINSRLTMGPVRFSLTATTTIYLVAIAGFTVSTCAAFGNIKARRVR